MSRASQTLDDKYNLDQQRVLLSGTQALVRLPLMQRQLDASAGRNTAGFISGYRGSPLGGYDRELWRVNRLLTSRGIHFEPGLNEDLAATAVWGTQQVNLHGTGTVDGVFALWYGKGPGVDRSADVLKHANAAGSASHGGVLVICGDDHGCQSSTLPHQSEPLLRAALIPVLSPANVREYLDYGLLGLALSRYSGCWVGFKATTEIVESSATLQLDAPGQVVIPADFELPPGGLNIRWPDSPLEQEARLYGPKMQAVAAFARANRFDRTVLTAPRPRLGIVTTGKAYGDLLQAFRELGLDGPQLAELGVVVYKVGMPWPLEPQGLRAFATDLEEVLVIEEKTGLVEEQLASILYRCAASHRPRLSGKYDERGRELLPSTGELDPLRLARLIVARMAALPRGAVDLTDRLRRLPVTATGHSPTSDLARAPYFCSGCPHNTSTRVPPGSRAVAGIGCHSMALSIASRNTATYSQMGGEGAAWIGQSRFVTDRHIFQNLGDGTYSHSGLLAIRAAANAGVNITYKILFNDAVAMTGGQALEGKLTVADIARQVAAAGARQIVVVADDPGRYPPASLPEGVTLHPRRELDVVQRQLREIRGLTVMIYDQVCAAERRRRWKRGLAPRPPVRVFINEEVCEGCGDCSTKSNCIAVKPVETELGRKRRIEQSSCNVDLSCLAGFCPSLVVVRGGTLRKSQLTGDEPEQSLFASLPPPQRSQTPCSILVTGIGGAGVVTIGALLGMAAHLEGKHCSLLDFTGMAQKNGAVMSHIRISESADEIGTARIPPAGADLLLACDLVVAVGKEALSRIRSAGTLSIINADVEPTSRFIANGDMDLQTESMQRTIRAAAGDELTHFVSATQLATALCGDAIAANLLLLGYALQKGRLPLAADSLLRAIELNGVAVQMNKDALNWGRLLAHDPMSVTAALPTPARDLAKASLPEQLQRYSQHLREYQDAAYAQSFTHFVQSIAAAEERKTPGRRGLTETVATSLFKLMAYKDEYEIARLYTDGSFQRRLKAQLTGKFALEFHFAPPLLARPDPTTGEPRKRAFGPWTLAVLWVLARLKGLRGTWLDVFGYTRERRMERGLPDEYRRAVEELLVSLSPDNHALAVEIAAIPQSIRGFGPIKWRNLQSSRLRQAELLHRFRGTKPCPSSLSTTVTAQSGSTGA